MDFPNALRSAERALELDPSFIKALAKKGNAHFGMKEYHKALESFQKGLSADPNNQEFKDGVSKTQAKIYGGGESKEEMDERSRHAMADPEIQQILQDPNIMNLLRNLQEKPNDPNSLKALKDPIISARINKLMQAGILRTG
jgi:stress-induced-phosphoprotein 1